MSATPGLVALETKEPDRKRSSTRADIQALRALAVLAVVAYHGFDPGLRGGFMGVDVFFVISGFLIGGGLVRELARNGRIRFAEFYARRARRILPMALLVAVVTLVGSYAFASPARMLLWGQPFDGSSIVKDGVASTIYLPNVWFGMQQRDYLANDAVSPFLHYWSLGIEEQFYFVVPVLLALIWLLTRRSLRNLGWIVGTLTVVSFLYGMSVTTTDPSLAFFHPATRAWELGAGVLVAIAVESARVPRRGPVVRWGRFGALVVLVSVIAGASWDARWPGWQALIPVGATAALLWLGSAISASDGWWGMRPIQSVGNWSYSLYLWHWPVLVLVPLAVDRSLGKRETVGLMLCAIVLSGITYRFVERPPRRAPVKTPRDRGRIWAKSATGIVLTLAVAGGLAAMAQRALTSSAPSAGPYAAPSVAPSSGVSASPAIPEPVFADVLPGNLTPALTDAWADKPRTYWDGCILERGEQGIPDNCVYGSGDRPIVALFGDSHVLQWMEPFEVKADTGEISVLSLTASACPPMYLDMAREGGTWQPHCDAWRVAAFAKLNEVQPDVIVISVTSWYDLTGESDRVRSYVDGLTAMFDAFPPNAAVVFVSDTPRFADSRVDCAASHPTELSLCASPRSETLDEDLAAAVRQLVADEGGTYVDLTPYLCDATTCGIVQGDVLMYRDREHVTNTFAFGLAPILFAAVGIDANPDQ